MQNIGNHHETALKAFAAEVKSRPGLFAVPWCVLAVDDPTVTTPVLQNCPKHNLRALNPLTRPDSANVWDLVALFLRTTRKRRLDKAIMAWKEKNKRKAIRSAERAAVLKGLRPTTMLDALYRLRIRSNYEDADVSLAGGANDADALTYFDASTRILRSGLFNFELLIARQIGKQIYGEVVNDFVRRERGQFSKQTMQPRWQAIEQLL